MHVSPHPQRHASAMSIAVTSCRCRLTIRAFRQLPPATRDRSRSDHLADRRPERIERESVGFSKHAERLHAPGGTSSAECCSMARPALQRSPRCTWLVVPDRTVLLITGRSMGLRAGAMARMLQPATIILEDVDLIAEERTRQGGGCAPLLFELLNQMDGLADDADILFVLTTNRRSARAGAGCSPRSHDQAVEVPVPDGECRRRLFELYGRGLKVSGHRAVRRADGRSERGVIRER
jgi:hypothetical protein